MCIQTTAAGVFLIAATAFAPTIAASDPIDLNTPEGAIAAGRKIQCSLEDNQPIYFTWEGQAFGRRAGQADKLLFKITGMNVRQCVTIDGGKKGKGYRLVTREIMLYQDPKTGAVLNTWHNPWTGEENTVMHVANDPVNGRPAFPYKADGSAAAVWHGRIQEDSWFQNLTIPLFYHNVLQGDYQQYVGGAYHATEMFNFFGDTTDLLRGGTPTAKNVKVGWVRLAQWLPWMSMQGRDGLMYIHAAGQKVSGFDAMPEVLKTYINETAPIYKLPPPGDDKRPNKTSWSNFKANVDGKKLPRGGHN